MAHRIDWSFFVLTHYYWIKTNLIGWVFMTWATFYILSFHNGASVFSWSFYFTMFVCLQWNGCYNKRNNSLQRENKIGIYFVFAFVFIRVCVFVFLIFCIIIMSVCEKWKKLDMIYHENGIEFVVCISTVRKMEIWFFVFCFPMALFAAATKNTVSFWWRIYKQLRNMIEILLAQFLEIYNTIARSLNSINRMFEILPHSNVQHVQCESLRLLNELNVIQGRKSISPTSTQFNISLRLSFEMPCLQTHAKAFHPRTMLGTMWYIQISACPICANVIISMSQRHNYLYWMDMYYTNFGRIKHNLDEWLKAWMHAFK